MENIESTPLEGGISSNGVSATSLIMRLWIDYKAVVCTTLPSDELENTGLRPNYEKEEN